MLRAAGERGCTNSELWAIAHAAHSRISDLRARGHRIVCVREGPGVYRYTLEEPTPAKSMGSTIAGSLQLHFFLFGEVPA
jgi:hypothetical protein